ncbi:MAG: Serine/threonine-protein kinase PknD [Planctomycetes bacterium]|nr:Serine/threonine-protein kinase PknD [Planctomycetota bacterium]
MSTDATAPVEPASASDSASDGAGTGEAPPLPEIPGYTISERIGEGPSGPVFRGVHLARGKDVAVKVLEPSLAQLPGRAEAFRSEAEAAATLTHPQVVPVFEAGEADGLHYYAMELANGGTLEQRVRAFGHAGVPWREAVRMASHAAAGLAHLHAKGIVHRDLKPSSILLGRNGQVKLGAPVSALAVDGVPDGRGDSPFLAPEQITGGEVSAATDVYCLGASLYWALSGHPPYAGRSRAELLASMEQGDAAPVTSMRGAIPLDVVEIVAGMTARSPEARPQDAADVSRRLGEIALLSGGPQDRSHQKRGAQSWIWKALPVLVAAAGIAWFVASGGASALIEKFSGGPAVTDAGPQISEAQRRYDEALAREQLLKPCSTQNEDRWQKVADEYRAIGAEFSIDEEPVRLAWGRRRNILHALRAIREPEDAVVLRVERVIGDLIERSKTAVPDGRPRDVTTVMSERLSQFMKAEQAIAEGRPRDALDGLSAWIVAERTALPTRRASELEKEYIHGALEEFRTLANAVAGRLQTDLDLDREILRAHLCETTAFGGQRTKRREPDFYRASDRIDRLNVLVATAPARARLAARRVVLAEQGAAFTSVRAVAPAVPDPKKGETFERAVARSVEKAFPTLSADDRQGALLLVCEAGETDTASSLAGKHPDVAAAKGLRLHGEVLALEEHAELRASKDTARRGVAAIEWIEKHAATEASVLLPTTTGGGALDAHPVMTLDQVELWFLRWGEDAPPAPAGAAASAPAPGAPSGDAPPK